MKKIIEKETQKNLNTISQTKTDPPSPIGPIIPKKNS